jgi:hypothetical protein
LVIALLLNSSFALQDEDYLEEVEENLPTVARLKAREMKAKAEARRK